MPWRRFEPLVAGLMQMDGLIGTFFVPTPATPPKPAGPAYY